MGGLVGLNGRIIHLVKITSCREGIVVGKDIYNKFFILCSVLRPSPEGPLSVFRNKIIEICPDRNIFNLNLA